ncbi:MAG: hypothetical protein JST76_09930 [Bacteroidetes bacterium]|nr:hypothetical protein [Bacteroidota bacterium]
MPEIRRAYPSDAELALPLLRQFDPTVNEDEKWLKLFRHHWPTPEEHIGYIMIEQGVAIGFIGILFSRRVIAGREEKVSSLSSWIVAENMRQHSLPMLLFYLKDLKEYTITNFTPIPEADKIFRSMKWKYFEDTVYWIRPSRSSDPVKIEMVTASNVELLNPADRQIYEDHKQFVPDTDHVIATVADGTSVYLVLREKQMSLHRFITSKWLTYPNALLHKLTGRSLLQRDVRFRRLAYCSDKKYLSAITHQLAYFYTDHGGYRLLVDKRFLPEPSQPFYQADIIKLLYKSDTIQPADVDALYTELFVLNLK